MSGLFNLGDFVAHSGKTLPWKINCDALSPQDWECLARMVADMVGDFSLVVGVPRGGLALEAALRKYISPTGPTLIVDDVLTTGGSMNEFKYWEEDVVGSVVFARGKCPSWITPVFQMRV